MSESGTQLKQARESRGMTLHQVAAATKISISVLEAIERGDFHRLPGGIFSRAFVRSYALEVGVNPDDLVTTFAAELEAATPAAAEAVRPDVTDDDIAFLERQRRASLFLRVGLVVVALLLIGSFVYWRMTRAGNSNSPATHQSTGVSAPLLS